MKFCGKVIVSEEPILFKKASGGVCGVRGLFGDDYFKRNFTSKKLSISKNVLRAYGMLFCVKLDENS